MNGMFARSSTTAIASARKRPPIVQVTPERNRRLVEISGTVRDALRASLPAKPAKPASVAAVAVVDPPALPPALPVSVEQTACDRGKGAELDGS